MNLAEYKGVYVFAQQVDNQISSIALELIGKGKDLAKDLGTTVTAVLVGSNVKGLADELGEYGADKVIVVDDPELKDYRTEPYTHAITSVINEFKPDIFLIGATAIGRDLGPRVCARIHTGLTADCTQLDIGDFPLVAMPGKEQKHGQLLMTVRHSAATRSLQSLARNSVRRWLQYVQALCRSLTVRLAEKLKLSNSTRASLRTTSTLRFSRSLRQYPT